MGVAGHRGVDDAVHPLAQPGAARVRRRAPGHRGRLHPARPPDLRADQVARPQLRPAGLSHTLGIEGT
ncbi:hypothetical protein SBRY_20778 [Actinacidiphila bryophytorum]|uniref:Uncharacterized protein n=1 Tax=Actinacidiphila bryophytorum TaxID=1436133 RepID=A0A9W4GYH3_9ACTN|nr:hypothetical protein SBRY_20778 [Actinacidiphila bryophytorum]